MEIVEAQIHNWTPLAPAACRFIYRTEALPTDSPGLILITACRHQYEDLVPLIATNYTIPTEDYTLAFHLACDRGNENIVNYLLTQVDMSLKDIKRGLELSTNPKVTQILRDIILIRIFRQLNRIVCFERIKKFLLKKWILHPESPYIERCVQEFAEDFSKILT
jgi:ankyrin repeat protein